MDSIWVILSLSSWYYCVNLSHNVIIIMILLFLFGARCHHHHGIIGAQWGNLLIPLYDIIVFLFLGGFFPRRGPTTTTTATATATATATPTAAAATAAWSGESNGTEHEQMK